MRLRCLSLLVLLLSAVPASAAPFISLEKVAYRPGEAVVISLHDEKPFPENLTARIVVGGTTMSLVAQTLPEQAVDEPVGKYRLLLPEVLQGTVTLSLPERSAAPVMFSVQAVESAQEEGEEPYPTLSSLFYLAQPYLTNISAYEPIYFLTGTNPEKSKFQFSFKYRLFNPEGTLNKNMKWLQGLHLGFTQTSFWDLKSESSPFQDTSYKPELFHLTNNCEFRPNWLDGLFFQTGYQHESNGRALPDSRSSNYLYFEPVFVFYDETTKIGLGIAPRVWAYIGNDDKTNPDLWAYRGYGRLGIMVGQADGLVASTRLYWAKEGGSVQANLTYPVSQFLGDNLGIYLHLQYVNALAESLLSYQDREEAFRVGISLIR